MFAILRRYRQSRKCHFAFVCALRLAVSDINLDTRRDRSLRPAQSASKRTRKYYLGTYAEDSRAPKKGSIPDLFD
jgi:hypothetical protein